MPQPVHESATPRSALYRFAIPLLSIALGAQVWLIADTQLTRPLWKVVVLSVGLGLLALPQVRGWLRTADSKLRVPSARTKLVLACAIGLMSSFYFYGAAIQQQRLFVPIYTDESSYLIQARMLSQLRLWEPRHELADFFDSFYVITEPVYASQYFPGTALWVAPFLMVGFPYWIAMIAAAGIAVGVAYLLFCELFDGTVALLGAFMLVALPSLRMVSIMMLSQSVTLMLAAIIMLLAVRALRQPRFGTVLCGGAASGWLAITRPADAVAILLPLAAVLLWNFVTSHARRVPLGWLAAGAAACAPFIVLQLAANRGITGDFFTSPFAYYATRDNPRTSIGFHDVDPAVQIVSDIPQKRRFYDETIRPMIREHTPAHAMRKWAFERPRQIARETLPDLLLLVLLPMGLLQRWTRERLAVALGIVTFAGIYFFYTFFLPHYLVVLAPAAMVIIFGSLDRLGGARIAGLVGMFLVTLLALPQFNRHAMDMFFTPTLEPAVRHALTTIEHKPAVVLFRYAENQSLEEEAVYNSDFARIDDHPVIRAHDLGARNADLFRYYARGDANRAIYRFDRRDNTLQFIGFARELLK